MRLRDTMTIIYIMARTKTTTTNPAQPEPRKRDATNTEHDLFVRNGPSNKY